MEKVKQSLIGSMCEYYYYAISAAILMYKTSGSVSNQKAEKGVDLALEFTGSVIENNRLHN